MQQYKDCLVYNSTLASIKINYIIYCRNCMDFSYNTFLYLMIFLVSEKLWVLGNLQHLFCFDARLCQLHTIPQHRRQHHFFQVRGRNGNDKSKVAGRKFVSSLERTLQLMVREGRGREGSHNRLAVHNSVYLSSSQDKQIKPSSLLQSLQSNQRGNLFCHCSLVFLPLSPH